MDRNGPARQAGFLGLRAQTAAVLLAGCSADPGKVADSGAPAAGAALDIGGLSLQSLPGGTFTMGNDALMGPAAGEATEHEVTLSAFWMGATEVSNADFATFLSEAHSEGAIEVITGTAGPDAGKSLVAAGGVVLYDLDGTRVMKDHDDADGDGDPFSGVIEPENPLNLAWIAYDPSASPAFWVKDPAAQDWDALCDYCDHSEGGPTGDCRSDRTDWPELDDLPSPDEVARWPATFVRFAGAQAFADHHGLSLPTEAQWEYAARGGQDFAYAVHDGVDLADANWNQAEEEPARGHVRPVDEGQANPYGLVNLGGNAWEWTADHYAPYDAAAVEDPLVEVPGSTRRAWRGGSWNYHQATLESAGRYSDEEDRGNDHFGFRVVCDGRSTVDCGAAGG